MSPAKKRLLRCILALFLIVSLNFIIPRSMPGDPLTNLLGEDAYLTEGSASELRSLMGLDLPLHEQYLAYWRSILSFDLGYSYHLHSSVSSLILSRMKWTLLLAVPSLSAGAIFGTILGGLAGWKRGCGMERVNTAFFLMIYCTPPYFLSLLALYLFSFRLGLFPLKGLYSTGSFLDIAHHLMLPILVMSLFSVSRNFMIMRGSVLVERRSLYAAYARAKGLYGNEILFRHCFKNALLPIITIIALDFGFIFSGALFIEIVFSMNGMGNLIYDSLLSRDYPVLQGSFLIVTIMVILANLLADLQYSRIDPRVRWQ
ncbi:Binding-protein-dependent transport system inner membrane component [uncultured archaeon]|nr:Binding-protein-dependent transport system inner membrane component [uncultured archaeon]